MPWRRSVVNPGRLVAMFWQVRFYSVQDVHSTTKSICVLWALVLNPCCNFHFRQRSSRVGFGRCFRGDGLSYSYHATSKRYTSTLACGTGAIFSTTCTAAADSSLGSLFVQARAAFPNHPSSIINSKILPPFVVSTLLSSRTFFFLSLPSCFIASRRISALMAM